MSAEELRIFGEWFDAFREKQWDAQIESDLRNDKLRHLADKALEKHKRGETTELFSALRGMGERFGCRSHRDRTARYKSFEYAVGLKSSRMALAV